MLKTIECQCRTCKINAAKIGKALPLRAEVDPRFAAMLGTDRKAIHNVVADAHNPSLPNVAARPL